MIHCALIPKPMQQMRVEIATYVHAGLLHATTYKYISLYLWICKFSMFLILNSLLHAVKLLCFEISIPSELQMNSDPLFSREVLKSTIHDPYDPYDPCDPYDPLTAASFPKAEGLFRTTFRTISHSWMLGMSVICFRLQFILQFVRGQKEVIFAKTAQAYFLCAQDVKLYSCLHHQSTESTFAQVWVSNMGYEDEEAIELSNCNFR